jgi:hypothetical protein
MTYNTGMKTVTWKQYHEYLSLKRQYEMDLRYESAINTSLESDIDSPIRNCVMGLALLGCEPQWSCCGFDYANQPIHKSHQTGRCYFVLKNPIKTLAMFNVLVQMKIPLGDYWECQAKQGMIDFHADFKNIITQWDSNNSIHYAEQATQFIRYLELALVSMKYELADSYTLTDTNSMYRWYFPEWQYPPKESWTFTKEQFLERVHE